MDEKRVRLETLRELHNLLHIDADGMKDIERELDGIDSDLSDTFCNMRTVVMKLEQMTQEAKRTLNEDPPDPNTCEHVWKYVEDLYDQKQIWQCQKCPAVTAHVPPTMKKRLSVKTIEGRTITSIEELNSAGLLALMDGGKRICIVKSDVLFDPRGMLFEEYC